MFGSKWFKNFKAKVSSNYLGGDEPYRTVLTKKDVNKTKEYLTNYLARKKERGVKDFDAALIKMKFTDIQTLKKTYFYHQLVAIFFLVAFLYCLFVLFYALGNSGEVTGFDTVLRLLSNSAASVTCLVFALIYMHRLWQMREKSVGNKSHWAKAIKANGAASLLPLNLPYTTAAEIVDRTNQLLRKHS